MTRRREILNRVGINLVFEVETALQLATLSRQFLWVGHNLLRLGGASGNALKASEPGGAAELAPAGTQSAHFPGFLSHTNLLHLHTDVELLGQYLD